MDFEPRRVTHHKTTLQQDQETLKTSQHDVSGLIDRFRAIAHHSLRVLDLHPADCLVHGHLLSVSHVVESSLIFVIASCHWLISSDGSSVVSAELGVNEHPDAVSH